MKVAEDQKNVTTNKLQSKKEQPGTFDLVLYKNVSKMTAPIRKKKKSRIYHFDDRNYELDYDMHIFCLMASFILITKRN